MLSNLKSGYFWCASGLFASLSSKVWWSNPLPEVVPIEMRRLCCHSSILNLNWKQQQLFPLLSYKTKPSINWSTSRDYCTCFDLETMKTYTQCPLNDTQFVVYICIKHSWSWPLWDVLASSNYLKDRLSLKSSQTWQMKPDVMAELTLIFENWSYYCLMSTFLCTLLQYFSTKKWVYIIRVLHWICNKCRKNHTDLIFNHIYSFFV